MPSKAILTAVATLAIYLAPGALNGQAPLRPAPSISPDASASGRAQVEAASIRTVQRRPDVWLDQDQRHPRFVESSAAVEGAFIGAGAGGLTEVAVGAFIDQGVGMGGSSGALLLGLGGAAAGALVGSAIGHVLDNR